MTNLRIFVSHSKHDNNFGARLVRDLRSILGSDDAVWYDSEGSLYGGQLWWDEIKEELKTRHVFIVILSPDAITSPWVKDEIRIAWKQKNSVSGKQIIPILCRPCEVPDDLDTLQIISFLPPKKYEAAFDELLIALGISRNTTKDAGARTQTNEQRIKGGSLSTIEKQTSLTLSQTSQLPTSLGVPMPPQFASNISQVPGTFPSRPISGQSRRQRSPSVVAALILLPLILLGGGSFGIYGAVTGRWPWIPSHGPSTPISPGTTAQTMVTSTAQTKATSTAPASSNVAGRTWHLQHSGTSEYLRDIAWSGSQFVAVGGDSDGSVAILTSPDGRTWTSQNSVPSSTLYGVIWSDSQFVAVGESGILTSPDGHTWTAQKSSAWQILYGVAWSGSQFVVVGDLGTILTSPNGRTWTSEKSGTSRTLYSVVWSGSQFVAVGGDNSSSIGIILTSPDGRIWTVQNSVPLATGPLYGVAWSGSQFVTVGVTGTILTSPNGRTWTSQKSDDPTGSTLNGVVWSDSQFVAVGWGGTILTSPDGRTWTSQYFDTSEALSGVTRSGSQFVTVGDKGTILTSP